MWEKFKSIFTLPSEETHKKLRNIAQTLNAFCIIEIAVIAFFSWQAYDLLAWYKSIVTPETFNGTAFWAAIGSIVAAIFGASKHIQDTYREIKKDK